MDILISPRDLLFLLSHLDLFSGSMGSCCFPKVTWYNYLLLSTSSIWDFNHKYLVVVRKRSMGDSVLKYVENIDLKVEIVGMDWNILKNRFFF